MTTIDPSPTTRRLNHVEMVYAPGERRLAARVFDVLGCRSEDRGGPFLTAHVEPDENDTANNVFYASEVTAEQWSFERTLSVELSQAVLAGSATAYAERLRKEPQRSCHFGIRIPDEARYYETLDRIAEVGETDPELRGRVTVSGVFRPGDPGAYSKVMVQAFVRTDVVASGLLALGQHFELQWQLPRS